jgi:GH15 family glucan-1,4-alpha-glucosidase
MVDLFASSRQVILDCTLSNGAIVAANTKKPYYPKEAKDYRFVWPRDTMYIGKAAKILKLDIQPKFFDWLMRAEGWNETGLFYEKYQPNGRKAAHNFQPDQSGSVLIAIFDYYDGSQLGHEQLLKRTADSICAHWNGKCFNIISQDLWEERLAFPDLDENFTYTIAICARGLELAHRLLPNNRWETVSKEMKAIIQSEDEYFHRSIGKMNDKRVDASLLGLVWPAMIIKPDDPRMLRTVELIEEKIVKDMGVYRYEQDEYDGWMFEKHTHRKKGAGYWPLLNFWMSIYYTELGENEKAKAYCDKVLNELDNEYIPEQVFDNDFQVSVKPLAWSHAMYVIADALKTKLYK